MFVSASSCVVVQIKVVQSQSVTSAASLKEGKWKGKKVIWFISITDYFFFSNKDDDFCLFIIIITTTTTTTSSVEDGHFAD